MLRTVKKGKVTITYHLNKSDLLDHIDSCGEDIDSGATVRITQPMSWDPNVNSNDTFISVTVESEADID